MKTENKIKIDRSNFINLFTEGKLQINCKSEKDAKKLFKKLISLKLVSAWLTGEKISPKKTGWENESTTYFVKTVKLYSEVLRLGIKPEKRTGIVIGDRKLFGCKDLYEISFSEADKIFKIIEDETEQDKIEKEKSLKTAEIKEEKPKTEISKPKKSTTPPKPKKEKLDYSKMSKAELKAILDKRNIRHLYHDTLDILRKKCEESE